MLAAKPDGLSLNPGAYMVDRGNSSDRHTRTVACVHLPPHTMIFFLNQRSGLECVILKVCSFIFKQLPSAVTPATKETKAGVFQFRAYLSYSTSSRYVGQLS